MNILERAKSVLHGTTEIFQWLGSGGVTAGLTEAQQRADICLGCPLHSADFRPEDAAALAIKRFLKMKSKLALRVDGEKSLGFCTDCGCSLRLLVWQEQQRVFNGLSEAEKNRLPGHCWKPKTP